MATDSIALSVESVPRFPAQASRALQLHGKCLQLQSALGNRQLCYIEALEDQLVLWVQTWLLHV